MTGPILHFQRAIEGFDRHAHSIGAGQWHDPTPDTDWDVRMLVNHVTVEQLWVPPLVQGSRVTDVGSRLDGDQLGEDPVARWEAASSASVAAFGISGVIEGMVSLSSGTQATAEYCWDMTTDALIHSWDLARAIGADEALDPELVDIVYERTLPIAEHLHESGLFAPPVSVSDSAPKQKRLLGLFGRSA